MCIVYTVLVVNTSIIIIIIIIIIKSSIKRDSYDILINELIHNYIMNLSDVTCNAIYRE